MNSKRPYPFDALGYRRNPFGTLTTEEWTAVALFPPALEKVWRERPPFLQLLGEKGSGKTSALLLLAEKLKLAGKQAAFEYLPESAHRFQTNLKGLDVYILDEAQRLNWREKRRLLQQRPSQLVLSTHQDLTRWFRWQKLALSSVNLEEAVSLAHVTAVLDRRLSYFHLPGRSRLTIAPDGIQWLHQRFAPNLRAMAFFLYEVWQNEVEARELTAGDLTRLLRRLETAVT